MAKYQTKVDILLAKAESLYKTIISQKVSIELGLAIKNNVAFDKLDKDNQLTICKIVVEWAKLSETIEAEAKAEAAQAELKPDGQTEKANEQDQAK